MSRRLVIIGDSLCAVPYQHYSAAGVRVVGVAVALQALLPAWEVISYGVGGATSITMRDIARAAAAGHLPEVLVWAAGTNDVTTGISAATMQTVYELFLDEMAVYGDDPTVITCTVPPWDAWNAGQDAVKDAINTYFRASAAVIVDRDVLWRDPLDATQLNPDYLIAYEPGDTVHTNDAAMALWAQAIAAEVPA